MGKRQYTKIALKKKKKQWFTIVAPREFNEMEIGESLAPDTQSLVNRRISLSLGFLTGDLRRQNTKVLFRINEIKNDKATTEIIGYEVMPSHIRRMVKKEKSRIDDSFKTETKDNVKVVLKPFILTKTVTKGSVLNNIRKRAREFLTNEVKKNNFNEVANSIIFSGIQRDLRDNLKKIYPCNIVEIRKFYRL